MCRGVCMTVMEHAVNLITHTIKIVSSYIPVLNAL